MTGSIETITDITRLDEIFNTIVISSDIYLRTSSGSLKIKYLGYNSGQIAFRVPFIKSMPDSALAFARHKETTIYIEMKTVEKQENDVFIFIPLKVQLFHAQRQEGRANVSDGTKNLLYVTNFTSDFLLFDCIKREKRKMEILRDKLLSDLKKVFTEVKIHLNTEEGGDARMRFFYEFANSPIFVSNILQPPAPGDEAKMGYYREQVYLKEQFNMKRKGLISELAVPILFRNYVPVGYIQINNTIAFNESYLQILSRASQIAMQTMERLGIFTEICHDRLLVADISKSGLGVVFRDRKYIRFFKEHNIACFDLLLGDGTVIPASVIVKNIALMENKIIKLGCSLREIDPGHMKMYDSYIARAIKEAPSAALAVPSAAPQTTDAAAAVTAPSGTPVLDELPDAVGDDFFGEEKSPDAAVSDEKKTGEIDVDEFLKS